MPSSSTLPPMLGVCESDELDTTAPVDAWSLASAIVPPITKPPTTSSASPVITLRKKLVIALSSCRLLDPLVGST